MDIKIPPDPSKGITVEAVVDATKTVEAPDETPKIQDTTSLNADAISRISDQVATCEIGRDEAVEQILAEVFDSGMVKAAPRELGQELSEVLKALLETDPYLKSLRASLGSGDNDLFSKL